MNHKLIRTPQARAYGFTKPNISETTQDEDQSDQFSNKKSFIINPKLGLRKNLLPIWLLCRACNPEYVLSRSTNDPSRKTLVLLLIPVLQC